MQRAPVVFATLLLAATSAAQAQLNKCVGPDGKVSYQSDPCPETSKAKTTVAPPSGPASGGSSGPGGKGADGWDEDTMNRMREGCVRGAMRNGQAGWENDARANPKLGAFPHSEVLASVQPYCACLAARVRSSMRPSEFEAKGLAALHQYTADALNGGQCRPTGIFGRMLGN